MGSNTSSKAEDVETGKGEILPHDEVDFRPPPAGNNQLNLPRDKIDARQLQNKTPAGNNQVNLPEDEVDARQLQNKTPAGNNQTSDDTDGTNGAAKVSSNNMFTDKKNFVRELCDASLLAANVSQLRVIIDHGSEKNYYITLLVMVSVSIFSHVLFGILMIQRWRKARQAEMEHYKTGKLNPNGILCLCPECLTVERYDEISVFFVFLIVILNVGIAGIGLS